MSLHLPRTLRAGAGLLAGVLLLGGTVGVANAAETGRHAAEVGELRDRTMVMYDRLDSAIVLRDSPPSFRTVGNHAGLFWFSMYRFSVFNGAPPAVPA